MINKYSSILAIVMLSGYASAIERPVVPAMKATISKVYRQFQTEGRLDSLSQTFKKLYSELEAGKRMCDEKVFKTVVRELQTLGAITLRQPAVNPMFKRPTN